jgi:hypothetical protein
MFKTLTSSLDTKKHPTPEEIQKIPSFIFTRWLSGSPHAIGAANMINLYSDIPIENQYYMVKNAFAGKIKFIPYPKNESVDKLKKVQFVADHFKISEEKAQEYLEFISEDELQKIVNIYTEYELKKKG